MRGTTVVQVDAIVTGAGAERSSGCAFLARQRTRATLRPVEEAHLRYPRDIERIRRQITISALEGLATHLGGIKQGRKTLVLVSDGFTEPAAGDPPIT
jgi:hypothetical protein